MDVAFQAIPMLRSFDETKMRAFYIEFLGFTVDWEHRFEEGMPLYLQLSRGGMRLHVTEHHGDTTPGTTVFVATQSLAAYHAELSAKDYPNNRPGLDPAPWGGQMMEVIDPFGNRLRFWEDTE